MRLRSPLSTAVGVVVIIVVVGAPLYMYNKSATKLTGEMKQEKDQHNRVATFLLFVGYSRSRHTIISSLLDAHPHILLANEMNLLGRFILNQSNLQTREKMFDELVKNSRRFLESGIKGQVMNGTIDHATHFGFFVKKYWQGTYDRYIQVIGDKTGFATSILFSRIGPEETSLLVNRLEKMVKARVKFIHVTRNPFDVISTVVLRNTKKGPGRFGDHTVQPYLHTGHACANDRLETMRLWGREWKPTTILPREIIVACAQVNDPELLDSSITKFSNWAKGSAFARDVFGDRLLDVVGLEFVRHPGETLQKICRFLGITCSVDYLLACEKVVDPVPSVTRKWVVWTKDQLHRVNSIIKQYPFLSSYTFEN